MKDYLLRLDDFAWLHAFWYDVELNWAAANAAHEAHAKENAIDPKWNCEFANTANRPKVKKTV